MSLNYLLFICFLFSCLMTTGVILYHKKIIKDYSITKIIINVCFVVDAILVILITLYLVAPFQTIFH
jgi:hypothetical protein